MRDFPGSRGIELPHGSEDDPPEKETVGGLGNRKNRYFRAWLQNHPVKTFPGTLAFIRALKQAQIKVAVFSASRNAEAVLGSAGVLDLFDAKVDGTDMAELGLPGKPDPAMLREAAARLGTPPQRAAVVEDALAGVGAGARGGFGLVIGVDRAGHGQRLKKAGADLVVDDLAELALEDGSRLTVKTLDRLPSVWACEGAIRARIAGRRVAVFLDYDGTLTPIVEDHTRADLGDDMRAAIAGLARKVTVGIISGRDLADLRNRVALDSVFLAGSHGFDIAGPKGWRETLQKGVEFLPDLDCAEGIHLGAMAGTVDLVQRCYTGIEPRGSVLHIDPCLPDELERLRTEVRYRRQILDLEVDHEVLRISSRPFAAAPVTIAYRGHFREISPGQSYEFRLIKPRGRRTPCAPAGLEAAGKG